MPNNQDNNDIKKNGFFKKLFLFLIAVIVITGILIFAFPGSINFLQGNFEFVLLGVVIIISSLVIFSMLGLNFPNGNNYVNVRKIVTIEGYDNSYKLI